MTIKEARGRLELTQAEVARTVSVAPTYLSEVESGRRPLSHSLADRLGRALKARPRDLMIAQDEVRKAWKLDANKKLMAVTRELARTPVAELTNAKEALPEGKLRSLVELFETAAKFGETVPAPGRANPSRGIEGTRPEGSALDQLIDALGHPIERDGDGTVWVITAAGQRVRLEEFVDLIRWLGSGEIVRPEGPTSPVGAAKTRDGWGRARRLRRVRRDGFGRSRS